MRSGKTHWFLGFFIIFLGVTILLNNLGITNVNVGAILKILWPLPLIYWGVSIVKGGKGGSNFLSGGILILLGAAFLGRNLGWLTFDFVWFWKIFWPVVLILFGASFLTGLQSTGKTSWTIMGGLEKNKEGWKLESGNYWAIMGGITLDLRRAVIEEEEEYLLNCNAIMGGIDIIVPPTVSVICEGAAVLGGVEFFGKGNGGIIGTLKADEGCRKSSTVIYISCRTLMGGIEVKMSDT